MIFFNYNMFPVPTDWATLKNDLVRFNLLVGHTEVCFQIIGIKLISWNVVLKVDARWRFRRFRRFSTFNLLGFATFWHSRRFQSLANHRLNVAERLKNSKCPTLRAQRGLKAATIPSLWSGLTTTKPTKTVTTVGSDLYRARPLLWRRRRFFRMKRSSSKICLALKATKRVTCKEKLNIELVASDP